MSCRCVSQSASDLSFSMPAQCQHGGSSNRLPCVCHRDVGWCALDAEYWYDAAHMPHAGRAGCSQSANFNNNKNNNSSRRSSISTYTARTAGSRSRSRSRSRVLCVFGGWGQLLVHVAVKTSFGTSVVVVAVEHNAKWPHGHGAHQTGASGDPAS